MASFWKAFFFFFSPLYLLLQIDAHEDDVNAVAFADSSSQLLFSGSDDALCKVWDRRTLREDRPQPVGHLAGHRDGITFIHSKVGGREALINSLSLFVSHLLFFSFLFFSRVMRDIWSATPRISPSSFGTSGSSLPKRGWQLPARLWPSKTGIIAGSRFPREVRRDGAAGSNTIRRVERRLSTVDGERGDHMGRGLWLIRINCLHDGLGREAGVDVLTKKKKKKTFSAWLQMLVLK